MLEKLTWARYGLILLAGWAGFACSQETGKPVEIGAAQVELRSDLVLPEDRIPATALSEEDSDFSGPSASPIRATRRITLTGPVTHSQDRNYLAVQRYEFLPALLKEPRSRKTSGQEEGVWGNPITVADKPWVLAGKGFGVAAEGMTPPGTVHLDDAAYYFPTVVFKPYLEPSEHLEPAGEPFKSHKPLIFHSGATGFRYEPPAGDLPGGRSPAFETTLVLSPIPETRVYLSAKPKTKMALTPAKNRLDLMNGNENLNRHRFRQRDAAGQGPEGERADR